MVPKAAQRMNEIKTQMVKLHQGKPELDVSGGQTSLMSELPEKLARRVVKGLTASSESHGVGSEDWRAEERERISGLLSACPRRERGRDHDSRMTAYNQRGMGL